MKRDTLTSACSWAEIKERLDPAWSYVVVEAASASSDARVFDAVTALLAEYAEGIHHREICRETTSGRLLMLVQVAPDQTEAVKQCLLGPRLPPSVTVFCYDQSPAGRVTAEGVSPTPSSYTKGA